MYVVYVSRAKKTKTAVAHPMFTGKYKASVESEPLPTFIFHFSTGT